MARSEAPAGWAEWMRKRLRFVSSLLLCTSAGSASADCLASADTQAETSRCACEESVLAEATLQAEYEALLADTHRTPRRSG